MNITSSLKMRTINHPADKDIARGMHLHSGQHLSFNLHGAIKGNIAGRQIDFANTIDRLNVHVIATTQRLPAKNRQ